MSVAATGTDAHDTRRLVLGLALATMLAPLGSTTIAVALPSIARDLGHDPAALTHWLVTSYLVVGIIGQSPGGKLGDRIGADRALHIGVLVFGLGTVAGALAHSLVLLVLARLLMGAGGALMVPSALAILRQRVGEEERPRAFGLLGAMMALAAAVGPAVGGELTERFGWPAIFLANVPLLLASALLARPGRSEVRPKRARFDVAGSVLLAIGLAALVVAVRARGPVAATLLVVGLGALVAFGLWERRAADPVADLGLLRQRPYAAAAGVIAFQNMAMYALLFEIPLLLAAAGVAADETGRVLLALTLGMAAGAAIGGRLAGRIGARAAAMLGAAIALGGLFALRPEAVDRAEQLLVPLVAAGLGLGITSAPAQAAGLGSVPRTESGMAAGLLSTLRYLGAVVGIAILGLLVSGADALPHAERMAHHGTAGHLFVVAAALALGAAALLPGGRPARVEPHRRVPSRS